MWKAWKGVLFEAIQGLYEMSLKMQRIKMHELRNDNNELYGPRKKLEGKQLEARMKASKAARLTHQVLKWSDLIGKALNWRIADLLGREVEMEMNGGEPIHRPSQDRISEKKKEGLIKYVCALKSLIAPYDPDAQAIGNDEENGGWEDDENRPAQPAGTKIMSKMERAQKICDSSLPGPCKSVDMKSEAEKRAAESEERNRREEMKVQTFLNCEMTRQEIEDIASAIWIDPRQDRRLHKSCMALRAACFNHTLTGNSKDDDKFIRQADALRNRGEWALDKKHTYRRMIFTDDMPSWLQPVEAMARHYQPIWCPEEYNPDGSPNLACYHYKVPGSDSP
jgi:hypothetical protein